MDTTDFLYDHKSPFQDYSWRKMQMGFILIVF